MKNNLEIDFKDISVVVQGAIDKINTPICLKSVRKYLPHAEIILSTWKGSDLDNLDYDVLVENEDPGFEFWNQQKTIAYNLNRQLVSTKNGVNIANKKYILKLRSDLEIRGTGFIKYFNKFQKRNQSFALSKRKIVACSLYTIKYEKESNNIHYTPFHISDWFFFGLSEDIKLHFSMKLPDLHKFSRYFEYKKKPRDYPITWLNDRLWKFPSEQYVGIEFAKQKFSQKIKMQNCLDYENIDNELSEQFIVNNFIILDYKQSNILILKNYYKDMYKHIYNVPNHIFDGIFRFNVYLKDYKKYCDNKIALPFDKDYFIRNYIKIFKIEKLINKLKRHLKKIFIPIEKTIIRPLRNFIKWLLELLIIMFYLLRIIINTILNFWRII